MPSPRRVIHTIAVGNTLIPLGIKCRRTDGTIVDLTGKTAKFYMAAANGDTVVPEAAATITDHAAGEVQYDFQASDVETKGTFYGYFNVYGGTEFERFPVENKDLTIQIRGDF